MPDQAAPISSIDYQASQTLQRQFKRLLIGSTLLFLILGGVSAFLLYRNPAEPTLVLAIFAFLGSATVITWKLLALLRPLSGQILIKTEKLQELLDSQLALNEASKHLETDQALAESERNLRTERDFINAVLDAAGSVIIVLNQDGHIVRFNNAAEQITGFSFEELCNKPIWEYLVPTEIRGEIAHLFACLTAGDIIGHHENELLLKDGTRRLFDWRNTVLHDEAGEVAYVISQGHDISEIRATQQALARHRDQLENLVAARTKELEEITQYNRTLFQASPIGLALCDLQGKLIDVNPAYLHIIGYSEAEAKQLTYWDLTPKTFAKKEQLQLEYLEKNGRYGPYEKEYIHKNGQHVPVLLNGLFLEQQGHRYIWSSVEDISHRKKIESALRHSEANLAHAQAIANLGSWYLDIESDELSWSEETYRIFELDPSLDVCLGHFVACLHPKDTDRVLDAWEAAQQGALYDIEHRILAGSKIKWVRERAELNFDAQGRALSAIGTVQDISELKRAELATQKALSEAQRLAKVRSEFVANMSHEIRTPLNGVLGLARIGQRAPSLERSLELFDQITESGKHLLNIVNDVLDFSKIEAGKLKIDQAPFNLAESIQNVVSLTQTQAKDKGLDYALNKAADLPQWVLGDALRVEQILLNLLSNAIKFTEKGKVQLSVERQRDQLSFTVSDTGIGLAADQIEHLFDPFHQADTSATRRFGGTGLGLSISSDLARLMGGDIQVASQKQQGSHFTLHLPLKQVSLPKIYQAAEPKANNEQRLTKVRILAVEDIEINRLILEDLLSQEGAEVEFAENGQIAIDTLNAQIQNPPDIILMDIQMPVVDGIQATQRILAFLPDLPIIGLTAHALADEKQRCLTCGMVDHVAKPIEPEILVDTLLRHLDRPKQTSQEKPPFFAQQALAIHEEKLIDWVALHQRYNGRTEFIHKIASTAQRTHKETAQKLEQALSDNDTKHLYSLAHSLVSLGGNFEAQPLADLARKVATAAKNNKETNSQSVLKLAQTTQALLRLLENTAEFLPDPAQKTE